MSLRQQIIIKLPMKANQHHGRSELSEERPLNKIGMNADSDRGSCLSHFMVSLHVLPSINNGLLSATKPGSDFSSLAIRAETIQLCNSACCRLVLVSSS